MIKNISPARAEYDSTYRAVRLHGEEIYYHNKFNTWNEIQECAMLSYDYHDSDFDGWKNRTRMAYWWNLKVRRYPELVFPF